MLYMYSVDFSLTEKPLYGPKIPFFSITPCLMKRRHLYSSLHCWRGRRRAPWWPGRPGASPHSPPSRQDSAPTRLIRKTKLWLINKEARRKVVILENCQNCISVTSADESFERTGAILYMRHWGCRLLSVYATVYRWVYINSHPANKYDILLYCVFPFGYLLARSQCSQLLSRFSSQICSIFEFVCSKVWPTFFLKHHWQNCAIYPVLNAFKV